ncbi:MAG TPA: hypothetical protein VFD82_12795 [Planctomycetota bacterium]|nr:hypothetical protein [Planctomycetota bacterium]
MLLLRCICIALSSTVLFAQNYSPVHFGSSEGPDNNVFPFGYTATPFRYSQIHDDVPLMVVTGMAFRHDYSTGVFPGYSVTMNAWMSTAVTASSGMSTTFDNNHGVDKTQVIINRTYTLPPSDPSNLPGQFVLDYPFDVPFVCLGAPFSLCWEVQITARTNTGNIIHDSVSGFPSTTTSNPQMAVGRFGVGCLSSGMGSPMAATGSQSMDWVGGTASMTTSGTSLLPNGIVLFATGADKTQYLGIPLPFTLPGTSCTVYNDMIVSTAALASPTGTASNSIPFVPQPAYNGLTFYTQIWGLDPTANPFGLTMSRAVSHNIVAPYTTPIPLHRVYLLNSLGPTGNTESYSYGLVTKFY